MKRKAVLKRILLLFCFCNYFTLFSQSTNDTIFLKKSEYDKIYIDPNVNSNYYKLLEKTNISNNSKGYVLVHNFENNFYLYAPCDWMYNFKIEIHYQKIFFHESEIIEFKIIKKRFISNGNFIKYKFKNSYGRKGTLEIKPFNDKGIEIIKIKFDNQAAQYQLMVDVNKMKNFQIIINDCQYGKTKEFKFNEMNLEEIFNSK